MSEIVKNSVHKRITTWDASSGMRLNEKVVTVSGKSLKECSEEFDKRWEEKDE